LSAIIGAVDRIGLSMRIHDCRKSARCSTDAYRPRRIGPIGVFPIWADLVDVKSGDQQCELCLSHPFRRIKGIEQWAVDPDPFLTSTTSAKNGKTAIDAKNTQADDLTP